MIGSVRTGRPLGSSSRGAWRWSGTVPEPELAPERLLGVLREHGVRFVVIGGCAAVVHGSPHVTFDIDVVPERADENLERLSDALSAMHARVWTSSEPDGVPFSHHAHSLPPV